MPRFFQKLLAILLCKSYNTQPLGGDFVMDNEIIKTLFDEDFCEISRCRLSDEEFVNTNEKSSSTYDALAAQLACP